MVTLGSLGAGAKRERREKGMGLGLLKGIVYVLIKLSTN